MRPALITALAVLAMPLAACGGGERAAAPDLDGLAERASLPEWFDCLREAGAVTLAAHRGGPASGFPENALETLQSTLPHTPLMEVDVSETADGVLILMHDETLDRTTTGSGRVEATRWEAIQGLKLKDPDGEETAFSPPLLSHALRWAKRNDAVLELDRKGKASFDKIIRAVGAAGARDHVVLIAYDEDDLVEIERSGGDLMRTASVNSEVQLRRILDSGVKADRLIAWTGTETPDGALWSMLRERGIEPAFGTLGRPGLRLDDAYWADGNGEEYDQLVEMGVTLLATDAPVRVARHLEADDTGWQACGR